VNGYEKWILYMNVGGVADGLLCRSHFYGLAVVPAGSRNGGEERVV